MEHLSWSERNLEDCVMIEFHSELEVVSLALRNEMSYMCVDLKILERS